MKKKVKSKKIKEKNSHASPSRAAFAGMAAAIRELQPGFCLTRDWVDPVLPAIPESWVAYAESVFGAPRRQRKAHRRSRTR